MLGWLEQAFGALLVLLVLLDVVLTVLYARIGAGLISGTVPRVMWWLFRRLSKPLGQNRAVALSYCGPAILGGTTRSWAQFLRMQGPPLPWRGTMLWLE
jgi:predicted histidine transporter YuiF (NhaC family)